MAEEVDVFYIPHVRMKQLVTGYLEEVKRTDFTNNLAVESLLAFLHKTFLEFKCHEDIEDHIIIEKLQSRLEACCVENLDVCRCHSNSQIGQMIALIDDGIAMTDKSAEDLSAFTIRLQQAVDNFTINFLPHMKEEEEIYQPLMIKYFEHNELEIIRKHVIVEHCSLTNNIIYETLMMTDMNLDDCIDNPWTLKFHQTASNYIFNTCNKLENSVNEAMIVENNSSVMAKRASVCDTQNDNNNNDAGLRHTQMSIECETQPICIMDLPTLSMTKIFSFLHPPDLGRCAQVCRTWNELVYQPCLWRRISPTQWAVGHWANESNWSSEQYRVILPANDKSYFNGQGWDADTHSIGISITGSDVSVMEVPHRYSELYKRFLSEYRVLTGLLRFVLCRIGIGVKELNLGASCVLNDVMFNLFMLQCPNLVHLDVSYTALSTHAFNGVKENGSCRLLKTICFAGCENLEDSAFSKLIKCWETVDGDDDELNGDSLDDDTDKFVSTALTVTSTIMTKQELLRVLVDGSEGNDWPSEEVKLSIPYIQCKKKARVSGLHSLTLSGCSKLTDKSLKELMTLNVCVKKLKLLDLSGCFLFTAHVLNKLVKSCPNLSPECLFYCDYICGGPYSNEANGCNNLQSIKRACCIPPEY